MSEQAPIVIIGTGLSGYSLARELRKLERDSRVIMITADDGHSYSKPMLSTGFTKGKGADDLSQGDPARMTEQLDIEVRTYTTVTGIDTGRHRILIGDEELAYSKLVLAWGADVIRLDLEGDGLEYVYSINDLMDYRRFREAVGERKRIAIMGAGLIGCEFANDLINGGYEVDVIAPCTTALPGLLPDVAGDALVSALSEAGVRFHLDNYVKRVDRQGHGALLRLANGDEVEADLVISAVGLRPRIQLAEAAGLKVERGIVVNRALETSAPDVYALGDCAQVDGYVLLFVLPLMACARALAKTLAGERTEVQYGTMPVVIKTPCCPTVVCPPPIGLAGEWQVEGEGQNIKALFRDADQILRGFALTGSFAIEKQQLAKEVPPLHG